MSRLLTAPSAAAAPAASKPLLAAVQQKLGLVPNMFRAIASSPAGLEGYLALNTLTNYVNLVAGTDLDFPRVEALKAA